MSKCLDDLRQQYSRDLKDTEIDEIFHEANQLYKQVQAAKYSSNANAEAQRLAGIRATQEQIAAALQKRNIYMQRVKRVRATEYILGNWQGREADGLIAMMENSVLSRQGARLSVDSIRNGQRSKYLAGFMCDILDLGGEYEKLLLSGTLDHDIAIALHTINNPKAQPYAGAAQAMEIAKVMRKWQEWARLDENRVGGFIGKEDGYIVRQSHDMGKIGLAGFKQWKADIENRLDWSRTARGHFDPAINPATTIAERDAWLEQVYKNLSTGEHLQYGKSNPLASASRLGSTASYVSHERVLHFTDGEAWYQYNQIYGRGTVAEAFFHGLSFAADKYSLMRVFGPSPEANVKNIIKSLEKSINKRGDIKAANRFRNKKKAIWDSFDYINGAANIPSHNMMARVGRYVRGVITMNKLGAAVISAMSDAPIFATEMAYQGQGFCNSLMRGIGYAIKRRGTAEQKRIMALCGVFHDSMIGDLLARYSGSDIPGAMSKALNFYFKINGLALWTDSWKKAATLMMAHNFAIMRQTAWGNLKMQERRLFDLYNIDEGKWNLWRKGNTNAADGRHYLTPDAVKDIRNADIVAYLQSKGINPTKQRVTNFREEFRDELRAMFRDRVQYAVIEPDAKTNRMITMSQRPGTVLGEAMRYAMQFKSFPIAFLQRPFAREIYGRGADAFWSKKGLSQFGKGLISFKDEGGTSNLGKLIFATTVFGYCAMTLKQLIAGKTPRDVTDYKTWLAAGVQGGGLGIYGDFLFGNVSRSGASFLPTLAGPTASSVDEIYNIYGRILRGEDVKANVLRTAFNLTPGNNLFWLRAGLDYAILNPAFESINPGYLRRMRRRILKENGQTFYRSPAARY